MASKESSGKTNLSARQAQILAAIVKENCDTKLPVASKDIVDKGYLDLSGATIRNEMQALEKLGYIFQPHTSSGRLPTDQGYRYFIGQLMHHAELSAHEQMRLQLEIRKLQRQHYELGRSITRLLAESSNSAAFALLPQAATSSGFSNIINSDLTPENLKTVAGFFDNLDQECKALVSQGSRQIKTYIGNESPIPLSDNVSMIVSQVKMPGGKRGVVGIIGSKRMKYAKNISLLEYVSKLISGGTVAMMFFLIK
jgi:transcriptional regulator of heat shock response